MSLIKEVKTLLTGVSNVYLGFYPATPDDVVAIRHSGGYARDHSGTELEQPTIQILVRRAAGSYEEGITLCETIKDLLHGYVGGKFVLISQQGDIFDLGRDPQDRPEWSLNFTILYRR